ncbi:MULTISPECIES: sugar ABC transporter ATP-binding protein [Clostridium]|uniref:Sugar ABC transporter ATP-binding protein n=4 Tax=Clostridium TaxID=1485 RepID=A0A3M0SAN1_9CLOT|nr:putative ABC-type sugar transporter, ATPase component [Clostridium ljungdahlii DSM 13528]ALU36609.1 Ribose import ATP-binding protein rbsA [Clostridium autoethanogenum DSM 10061]OAA83412.1 Ribose import ATP-binding protein RbsA [Clostridium ljungdahlii DSM 13528]OVY48519.1 Ribose import ATP-binding protein RbsA [Clostridium autoethanogenum]RMC95498.1 sugar ABC transporter ATP-binding protein [Clostridium autoethanogenum]
MSETILKMENITKSFSGVTVLKNSGIEVKKGEVHILLGENGAGKSTLMKILSGAYSKDSGDIILNGNKVEINSPKDAEKLGISIIYQEFNLVPYMTVAENIYLGREPESKVPGKVNFKKMYNDAQKMIDYLNVDIPVDKPIKNLGIAQQQMVEIAKALSVHSDIIIMDEPTAALTEKEIDNLFKIMRKIKSEGVSIIYISHRLEEFAQIGDRVTVMRDGETVETVNIKGTSIDELIKLMVGREIKEKFPKIKVDLGEEILRVKGLTKKGVFENINFSLRSGEILGFSGLMGAGRTEVMRAIFGIDSFDSGEIYLKGKKVEINSPMKAIKNGIGFVTENRRDEGLVLQMGVGQNITLASLGKYISNPIKLNLRKEVKEIKDYISKLSIKSSGYRQIAGTLSGGNQQKIVIAKWLLSDSKVLIVDEPTRGIDVGAKIEIYNIMNDLVKSGVGIIMVSSELPEVLGMSDRILVMCRGKITGELNKDEATQEKIMHYATGGIE